MHVAVTRYSLLEGLMVAVSAIVMLDSWYIVHRMKQVPVYLSRYHTEAAHRDRDRSEMVLHYAWEYLGFILLAVGGIVVASMAVLRFLHG